MVAREYELELPADAPSGDYALQVGLYHWQTGERLPIWDEHGERQPGDAATLGVITVAAPRVASEEI